MQWHLAHRLSMSEGYMQKLMSVVTPCAIAVVDMFPDCTVVGSKVAINFLKGLSNR